jgi:hypothetical protein
MQYVVDGRQIYKLADTLLANNDGRSEEVLIQKIKSANSTDFKQFVIYSIDQVVLSRKSSIYNISLFSENGNFMLTILDSGQLFLITSKKLSPSTSFTTPTPSNLSLSTSIKSIHSFLIQKYSFSNY